MACEYQVQTTVMGQLHPALARTALEMALMAAANQLGLSFELTPNDPRTVGYIDGNRVWLYGDGEYGLDEGSYSFDQVEETMAPLVEQAYIALGWKLALEAQGKKVQLVPGDNGAITVQEV